MIWERCRLVIVIMDCQFVTDIVNARNWSINQEMIPQVSTTSCDVITRRKVPCMLVFISCSSSTGDIQRKSSKEEKTRQRGRYRSWTVPGLSGGVMCDMHNIVQPPCPKTFIPRPPSFLFGGLDVVRQSRRLLLLLETLFFVWSNSVAKPGPTQAWAWSLASTKRS